MFAVNCGGSIMADEALMNREFKTDESNRRIHSSSFNFHQIQFNIKFLTYLPNWEGALVSANVDDNGTSWIRVSQIDKVISTCSKVSVTVSGILLTLGYCAPEGSNVLQKVKRVRHPGVQGFWICNGK